MERDGGGREGGEHEITRQEKGKGEERLIGRVILLLLRLFCSTHLSR